MKKLFSYGIVFISLFLLFIGISYAGTINLTECDYTDDYIKWLALSDEEKALVTMPTKCKDNGTILMGADPTTDYTLASYNLKDSNMVLGVRDQGSSGTCWAFAATTALASNLLMEGKTTTDFSPAHLEFMTQDTYPITNLKTYHRTFNTGGTYLMAAAYFLNHWGPVYETTVPFSLVTNTIAGTTPDLSTLASNTAVADVNDVMFITNDQGVCSTDTITNIKKYLVTYGAMAAGMYFEINGSHGTVTANATTGNNTLSNDFINGAYYYYDGSAYTVNSTAMAANQLRNHGITIVGWDDNVAVTSFSTYHQPTRKGAWIVQNSYGLTKSVTVSGNPITVDIGNGGYYYVSYDDINICTNLAGYYDTDTTLSNYEYGYDYLGLDTGYAADTSDIYVANKFTKQGTDNQKIDKITFASAESGLDYSVYYSSTGDLTTKSLIGSGTTASSGYISVVPDTSVYVTDNFAVIVKFSSATGNPVITGTIKGTTNNDPYSTYELTSDVSYLSSDGGAWTNYAGSTVNYQSNIKVYSSTTTDTITNPSETTTTPTDSNVDVNVIPTSNSTLTSSSDIENPKTGNILPMMIIVISVIVTTILVYFMVHQKSKFYSLR